MVFMKKTGIILLLCFMLSGCASQDMMETICDTYDVPVVAQLQQIQVKLPEDATLSTMGDGADSKLYLCDDYAVSTQILEGRDIDRTFQQTTGFTEDALAVMKTVRSGLKRYDCVWTAAGEGEEQVFRAVILDDGQQHYTVTLSASASKAGDLAQTWQEILDSVTLISTG